MMSLNDILFFIAMEERMTYKYQKIYVMRYKRRGYKFLLSEYEVKKEDISSLDMMFLDKLYTRTIKVRG